jgi:hypothetical protein
MSVMTEYTLDPTIVELGWRYVPKLHSISPMPLAKSWQPLAKNRPVSGAGNVLEEVRDAGIHAVHCTMAMPCAAAAVGHVCAA